MAGPTPTDPAAAAQLAGEAAHYTPDIDRTLIEGLLQSLGKSAAKGPVSPEAAFQAAKDTPKPAIPEVFNKATAGLPRPKPPATPHGHTLPGSDFGKRGGELTEYTSDELESRSGYLPDLGRAVQQRMPQQVDAPPMQVPQSVPGNPLDPLAVVDFSRLGLRGSPGAVPALPSATHRPAPPGVPTIPAQPSVPVSPPPMPYAPGAPLAPPQHHHHLDGAGLPDPLSPVVFSAVANGLFQGREVQPQSPLATPQISEPAASRAPIGRAMSAPPSYDIERARDDFPILHQKVNGKPLVWLDNAATTQKPRQVVEAISRYYYEDNSNVHRGAHTLAARATDAYEQARGKIATFLGASGPDEIVFVRGCTEAINLIANSIGLRGIEEGDEIVVTELEHHSNIVPWQMLCQRTGARLRVARADANGDIQLDAFASLLNRRTRIVSMTQVSNAIGTVVPVQEMAALARRVGACVIVDGAQSIQHMRTNVQELGCDFFVFSGHKIYGPSGVGALYGRRELLDAMPAWQGGGSMIDTVTFEKSTYAKVPHKFEAGTPILAGAVGLGAAIDYVSRTGIEIISRHEASLMAHMVDGLRALRGVRIIGEPHERAGAVSFVIDGIDVPAVGAMLDKQGIAVRSGHHCAQPALAHFGLKASVRPSLGLYNTRSDVDRLIEEVAKIADGVV